MLAYYYQAISCYHSSLFSTHIFSITSYCLPHIQLIAASRLYTFVIKMETVFPYFFAWVDRVFMYFGVHLCYNQHDFSFLQQWKIYSFPSHLGNIFLWIIQILSSLESNCWCYFKCLAVNIKLADLSENVGKIFLSPKPVSPVEFQVSVL